LQDYTARFYDKLLKGEGGKKMHREGYTDEGKYERNFMEVAGLVIW
jgi:hypothetical protein